MSTTKQKYPLRFMGTIHTHKGHGKAVVAPLAMAFVSFLSFPFFTLEKVGVINMQEERERKLLCSFFFFFFFFSFPKFFQSFGVCTAGVLSPCPAVSAPPPQKAAQEGPG